MANALLLPPLILSLSSLPPPFNNILKPKLPKVEHLGGFFFYKTDKHDEIKYLLMKQTKDDEWSLVKGRLEENESIVQCAIRETWEETGWSINADYEADFNNQVYFEYETKNGIEKAHLWPATLTHSKRSIKLSEEHYEYVWLEYDEAVTTLQSHYRGALAKGDVIIRSQLDERQQRTLP